MFQKQVDQCPARHGSIAVALTRIARQGLRTGDVGRRQGRRCEKRRRRPEAGGRHIPTRRCGGVEHLAVVPVAVAQTQHLQIPGLRGDSSRVPQTGGDEIMPGRAAFHVALSADDQPAFGPRHRDVEQSHLLPRLSCGGSVVAVRQGLAALRLRQGPQRRLVPHGQQRILHILPPVAAVGEDHDGRLQPFRSVHRHHPDPVGGAVRLAFDLCCVLLHPLQETGKGRHLLCLVGQRLGQQRVDPVLSLFSQPCDQPPPAVMTRQHAFDQIKWTQEIRVLAELT